jgi:hypothetical protein
MIASSGPGLDHDAALVCIAMRTVADLIVVHDSVIAIDIDDIAEL